MWGRPPASQGPAERRTPAVVPLGEPGRGAGGRKVEGSHDDYSELPRGRPPPVHGCPRRGPVGSFPRRPGGSHHITGRPGAPPPVRLGHLSTTGSDHMACRRRQGKEKEQFSPLALPQALVTNSPRWFGVTGLTSKDVSVSDGEAYTWASPGPINAADLAHVALAVETGGARLSDESSPLVESNGE